MVPVVPVANAHRIDVPVKGDDLLALAHPAQSVALRVDLRLVKAQALHLQDRALDDPLLPTALAGDGDQIPQEPCHIRLIAFSSPLDRFKIHGAALHLACAYSVCFDPDAACAGSLCSYHIIENAVVKQNF